MNRLEPEAEECSVVVAVITGMEHSGTTALAQLILSHCRGVAAGFECGVLLSETSPADFVDVQPFHDWFLAPTSIGHWGMTEQDLAHACAADDWCGFYQRVIDRCSLFEPGDLMIDKTPAYCYQLPQVLERLAAVPVLVTVKDVIVLYQSYKRRGVALPVFARRVQRFLDSLQAVQASPRVVTVRHRDLCRYPDKVLEAAAGRFLVSVDLAGEGDMNWNMRPLSRDYDFQVELEQAYAGIADEEREPLDQLAAEYDTVVGVNSLLQP